MYYLLQCHGTVFFINLWFESILGQTIFIYYCLCMYVVTPEVIGPVNHGTVDGGVKERHKLSCVFFLSVPIIHHVVPLSGMLGSHLCLYYVCVLYTVLHGWLTYMPRNDTFDKNLYAFFWCLSFCFWNAFKQYTARERGTKWCVATDLRNCLWYTQSDFILLTNCGTVGLVWFYFVICILFDWVMRK